MEGYHSQVLVCGGKGCVSPEAADLFRSLKSEVRKHKLNHEIEVLKTGCLGLCELGPIVVVYPEGVLYTKVKTEDIAELVESHFIPFKIIGTILANVSTLFIIVGLPKSPLTAGNGGLGIGIPLLPSIDCIRAVSSPHTKAPAPSLISISKLKPIR
jgi:(2Fe-2S) ferredoxin